MSDHIDHAIRNLRAERDALAQELKALRGAEAGGVVHATNADGSPWIAPRVPLAVGTELYAAPVPASQDDARDAERYRYLRNRDPSSVLERRGPDAGVWCDAEDENGELVLLTCEDLDAKIDAILAANEAKDYGQ